MKKILVSILIILLIAVPFGCSEKETPPEKILSYESEYTPLIHTEFGISHHDLISSFGDEERFTALKPTQLEGYETEYRMVERYLEKAQYGGELYERYCFSEDDDSLISMSARVRFMAPLAYWDNQEGDNEFKDTCVKNVQSFFKRLEDESGMKFEKSYDDLDFDGYYESKASDGETDIYVSCTFFFRELDEPNNVASKDGSFWYASCHVLVDPTNIETGFERAFEE